MNTKQNTKMNNEKRWMIHKFGGSSLKNADCFKQVVSIYNSLREEYPYSKYALVLSAMGGVTDQLIQALNEASNRDEAYLKTIKIVYDRHMETSMQLIQDKKTLNLFVEKFESNINDLKDLLRGVWVSKGYSDRLYDLIIGYGELWSTSLMNFYLHSINYNTMRIDARKVIICEIHPTGPSIDWDLSDTNLKKLFSKKLSNNTDTLVITGFIASTKEGLATTLQRNGSDFSASIFGVILDAESIHIWTDVDGLFSADPRRVSDARILPQISYLEALELAYFGAEVIHPSTVVPAMNKNIPLWIHNTFNPDNPGTEIKKYTEYSTLVKGFATIESISLINLEGSGMIGVPGISEKLFSALTKANISVVMISQGSSEYSICVAVDEKDGEKSKDVITEAFTLEILKGHIQSVKLENDCGILSAVGDQMVNQPGIASIFFSALSRARINVRMISQGSSERNISAIIPQKELTRGLQAVHSAFYLSHQTLSVAIIGKGLIGNSLMNQIQKQYQFLRNSLNIDLRINCIANSKKMLLHNSINLEKREQLFKEYATPIDIDKLTNFIQTEAIPHSVVIDCSASEEIADSYTKWLNRGIHVITPNKKANSSSYEKYLPLKKFIIKGPSINPLDKATHYFYETTVCAGLPVISTLKDLIKTGDKIIQIEGVFSGTMSYIFNELSDSNTFSEIVKDAKIKGYTEPDPRDDLSGIDIARKLIILAREIGFRVELSDVTIEQLMTDDVLKAETIDEFFVQLKSMDSTIHKLYSSARKNNEVLRYVGMIDSNGKCSINLKSYSINHPFANLKGSENITLFKTQRYNSYPLVIQGPGAGAEVTSGGVFAELIRLADLLGNS